MGKKKNRSMRIIEELQRQRYDVKAFSRIHFRVEGIDFWPSTGRWCNLKTQHKGRGLESLLLHLPRPTGTGVPLRPPPPPIKYPPRNNMNVRRVTKAVQPSRPRVGAIGWCEPECAEEHLSVNEIHTQDGTVKLQRLCEKCGRAEYLPDRYAVALGYMPGATARD